MAITDIRKTVLQIINEVQRKLGLAPSASLTANAQTIVMLDYLNDVIDEMVDMGNWRELLLETVTTAVASIDTYSLNVQTSVVVHSISDIYFGNKSASLVQISLEDMRRLTRQSIVGQPSQFTITGTDSNGNPTVQFRPMPDASQDGVTFNALVYQKPRLYTTSDANLIVPLPSRPIVIGLLAKCILDEEGGAPTVHYQQTYAEYVKATNECLQRYTTDTGYHTNFRPSGFRGRRR